MTNQPQQSLTNSDINFLTIQNNNMSYTSYQIENNWAFIDLQNLYKGVREKGWKIEWSRFRVYLRKYHNVTKAIAFLGYLKENEGFYNSLRFAGFTLEFRRVKRLKDGTIDGGNVDADVASFIMDYKTDYARAIIIADDGDYTRTITSLRRQNKLKVVISSHPIDNTSELIRRSVTPSMLLSIHDIRNRVGLTQQQFKAGNLL